VLAGVGLAILSALDGINAIMYYSTEMFKIAGQSNATMSSLAVGVTNFGEQVSAPWVSHRRVLTSPGTLPLFQGCRSSRCTWSTPSAAAGSFS
jgi:hypothetical protein